MPEPLRKPTPVMPDWPAQPNSADDWNAYNVQLQAAALDRLKLGRATLVMMVAQCDECHGKRCQYCENTWRIIDQLEVPAWLR